MGQRPSNVTDPQNSFLSPGGGFSASLPSPPEPATAVQPSFPAQPAFNDPPKPDVGVQRAATVSGGTGRGRRYSESGGRKRGVSPVRISSAWDGAGSDDRWASVSCATTEGFKGGTERDEGCDAQAGLMRVRRRSLGGALRRHTGAIDPRHVPSLCNSTQSESNIMTSCRKIGCALALSRWASSLDITEPTRRHARLQTASWSKG